MWHSSDAACALCSLSPHALVSVAGMLREFKQSVKSQKVCSVPCRDIARFRVVGVVFKSQFDWISCKSFRFYSREPGQVV